MYIDASIRRYLEDASAGQPTPGGGSVAALAGALGASMACMAANFTVGRKKFASVEPRVRELLDVCGRSRDALLTCMETDVQAYASVSAAYGLPKGTEAERAAREGEIQKALRTAIDPPLQTLRICRDLMPALSELVEIANRNLISDVGVAALLCDAALRAARLNVEINLREMKDTHCAGTTREEIAAAARASEVARDAIHRRVTEAIGGQV